MKMKKLRSLLGLAMASVLLLAACSSGVPSAASTPGPAPSGPSSAAKAHDEPVTLTLWTWSPIPRTAEKMIAAFEAENPGIKINYTNYNYNPEYLAALSAGAAANNLPDIIGLQPGSLTQQYRDYLIPLDSYATGSWGGGWKDNFYKIAADQITLGNPAGDNNAYILPIESQVIYIVYNKTMFNELGIQKPTTYEQLKTAAKTLTDAGIAPFWLGGADGWQNINLYLMLINQIDTEIFDKAQQGEVKWTDEKFVQAMDNWKKMFDDGIFQVGALSNTSYPQGVNALTSKGAGMIALGSWWFQEFTAPDPADTIQDWVFDGFYLPPIENGLQASAPIGGVDFGYGITKNCKNPEAAWKALESFSSGAGIQACVDDLNNLPAYKGIAPKASGIPETILTQTSAYSKALDSAMNQRIGEPTIDTALQNALAGVAAGDSTPQAALQTVQDAQDALS